MVELITCTKFKLTTVAFNTLVGGGGGSQFQYRTFELQIYSECHNSNNVIIGHKSHSALHNAGQSKCLFQNQLPVLILNDIV